MSYEVGMTLSSVRALWRGGGVRGRLAVLGLGVALITIWLSMSASFRAAPVMTTAHISDTAPAIPVSLGIVAAADVPNFLHGIGTVQAFNKVTVRSRVDGPIIRVDFAEGQEVEAGSTLFKIDPRPYLAALAQAKAARNKDAAQLESAQLDLERYARLLDHGIQTQQTYDRQKALVGQLRAAIDGDQAQIDTAQLNVDYTEIRAPISGRLGARLIDIGNLVHASDGTALLTITQVRPIFVSFTLPQQSFGDIREQQMKSPLVVDAFSGDDMRALAQGQLTLIDNSIDGATGTLHLKAQFDNENEHLWPGQFVNVRVTLSTRRSVPTVPSQAVQDGPEGYEIYVVGLDDTVHRKLVQVATIQDGIAAVTDGLSPGERVVTGGQFRLTDGARVKEASRGPSISGADVLPRR
jgi:multidrug efflux system membrane fusion protein